MQVETRVGVLVVTIPDRYIVLAGLMWCAI